MESQVVDNYGSNSHISDRNADSLVQLFMGREHSNTSLLEREDNRFNDDGPSHQNYLSDVQTSTFNDSPISDSIKTPDLGKENEFVVFQLIPISEEPDKPAVGEVMERKITLGDVIKIGRKIIRDGQVIIKGTKKATELDIWYTSKVVSRLHAEIWTKDGQVVKSLNLVMR